MSNRPIFYMLDALGNPVPVWDIVTWGLWFGSAMTRQLARDYVHGAESICVSTVFLGMDHNYTHDGPPVLWETCVFGGRHDGRIERYRTRAAALAGHARIVETVTGEVRGSSDADSGIH